MTAALLALIALPLVVAATLLFTSWAENTLLRDDATPVRHSPGSAPTGGASG